LLRHRSPARDETSFLTMAYSPLLQKLVESLRCLPGVGPKSAQRMAFQLLERNRSGALALAEALQAAMQGVGHCERCRMFTEAKLCETCANPKRDATLVCAVETPADVNAIEGATGYRGQYFVLMGHLSPLDGIGPDELGLALLERRLDEGTGHYLAELAARCCIRATPIGHGVPIGGELEYVDGGTLSHAFSGRQDV